MCNTQEANLSNVNVQHNVTGQDKYMKHELGIEISKRRLLVQHYIDEAGQNQLIKGPKIKMLSAKINITDQTRCYSRPT